MKDSMWATILDYATAEVYFTQVDNPDIIDSQWYKDHGLNEDECYIMFSQIKPKTVTL